MNDTTLIDFNEEKQMLTQIKAKKKGRPPKMLDPNKVKNLEEAMRNSENGVGSAELLLLSGLSKTDLASVLRRMLKEERAIKLGAKRGTKYLLVK